MTTLQIVITLLFTPIVVSVGVIVVLGARTVLKARRPEREDPDLLPAEAIRTAYERSTVAS